jgi:hypothetical protein
MFYFVVLRLPQIALLDFGCLPVALPPPTCCQQMHDRINRTNATLFVGSIHQGRQLPLFPSGNPFSFEHVGKTIRTRANSRMSFIGDIGAAVGSDRFHA